MDKAQVLNRRKKKVICIHIALLRVYQKPPFLGATVGCTVAFNMYILFRIRKMNDSKCMKDWQHFIAGKFG